MNDYRAAAVKARQGELVRDAQQHGIKLMLKWGKPGGRHRWSCTVSASEQQVMFSIPNTIRNAYKVVKTLLEVDYWQRGGHYAHAEKLITSYMVKNAMFWLLYDDIKHGRCEKLELKQSLPASDESPVNCEESRQWAIRIVEYLKQETEERLSLRSFFISNVFLYNNCYLRGIRDTCEKFLRFLRNEMLLSEELVYDRETESQHYNNL